MVPAMSFHAAQDKPAALLDSSWETPLLNAMRWHNPGPVRHPPGLVEPCLPTNGHAVPAGPQWAYEIKHDGYRFIVRRDLDRVRVFSRRGNDWTVRCRVSLMRCWH
jgi:ATP-dependent DNA ligase